MRRLQEETLCKMAILGRGSMKDRKRVRFSLVLTLILLNIPDILCFCRKKSCVKPPTLNTHI